LIFIVINLNLNENRALKAKRWRVSLAQANQTKSIACQAKGAFPKQSCDDLVSHPWFSRPPGLQKADDGKTSEGK